MLKQRKALIVNVNYWFKDGEFGGLVEYFDRNYLKKLFLKGEEVKEFFGLSEMKKDQNSVKETRQMLKNSLVKSEINIYEGYSLFDEGFEGNENSKDTE